jgi:TATA-binding protein-associated factor
METDQILDLFNIGDSDSAGLLQAEKDKAEVNEEDMVDATGEVREKGKKGWLDDLGELWDEKLYEEEFGLEGFLGRMKA